MRITLRLILILLGALGPSMIAFAAAPAKTILISDIDDTIKDSQMKPAALSIAATASQYWHMMTTILSSNNSFIGIPLIYTALAANGVEIHYVSGGIEFFGALPEKFLQSSGFPKGRLWMRPNLSVKTEDYKLAQIQKIILSEPTANFILLGDNGEKDVTVYRKLKADPNFGNQIREVYIHHLYSNDIGEVLTSDQKPFLTAADLAIQLLESGALTEGQTYQVLRTVEQGLSSPFQGIQRRTFPALVPLDLSDLNQLKLSEKQVRNPTLRALFRKIVKCLWLGETDTKTYCSGSFF